MWQTISSHHRGVTLMELSVVLLVLSLLAGGVLLGRDLMDSARLQNVIAEKTEFVSAINQFKDKYKGLPGDLFEATSFWPTASSCPYAASSDTDVCNGDGDGEIASPAGGTSEAPESHRAWRQLALAGFIDGEYTGQYESSGTVTVTPGVRVPKTVYDDATGWHLYQVGKESGDANFFDGDYGHILYLGDGVFSAALADKASVAAEDVQSMDRKIDDGQPDTGNIRGGKSGGTFGGSCICNACLSNGTTVSTYVLTTPSEPCVPIFLTGID